MEPHNLNNRRDVIFITNATLLDLASALKEIYDMDYLADAIDLIADFLLAFSQEETFRFALVGGEAVPQFPDMPADTDGSTDDVTCIILHGANLVIINLKNPTQS